MKVGLIYTVVTPQLTAGVEGEVRKALGDDVEILSFDDVTVLDEIKAAGYITPSPAARYIKMCMSAVEQGADALMVACSSVGDVGDALLDVARLIGVPIVRIDEEMCREAVRLGKRIAVMATQPSTLVPTKSTLLRVAREMGRRIELIDLYMEGAFGLSPDEFLKRMISEAAAVADSCDVILLAQGSMAFSEKSLRDTYKMPVLSSPRFGAAALRQALIAKGTLK